MKKAHIPTHVQFVFEGNSQLILCEQARTVDIMALGRYQCTLSDDVMEQVEKALAIQFGIRPSIKLTDFTLENTAKTLESIVEKILQDKIKQQEEIQQQVSIGSIEDAAIKFGEMVEDLIGTSIQNPSSEPVASVKSVNKVEEQPKNDVKKNGNQYKGLSQIDKFNQRYNITEASKEEPIKAVKKSDPKKKRRNTWTRESRIAYLKDCEELTPQEVMKKYGFSNVQSVFQTKYTCKNALSANTASKEV